jgi:hypothetical protein
MVVVIVGDHQPPAAVAGPDAPWHVPVHVIARQTELLQRLLAGGFRAGLTPQRPSIAPMHALTPMLLDAFDATGADE